MTVRRLISAGACVLVAALAAPVLAQGPSTNKNTRGSKPAAPSSQQVSDAARATSQAAQAVQDVADQAGSDSVSPEALPKNERETPVDRARDGIVVLERAGKQISVGSVLAGDGRILSALSPLGHGNDIDARFADGSVSRVKIGHSDRAWDLALLIPQNARWKKGLKASRVAPTKAGSQLRTFSTIGAKEVAPSRTIVKGRQTLIGGDSELLQDALELASRFKPNDIGSPILDDNGDVVGMVAKACAPVANQPCSQVPYGVPVGAIKAFLRTVPANAVPPAPWLGIQGVADEIGPVRAVRVVSVHPKSPAAAAGLRGGNDKSTADSVVAIDGAPVTTPEALAEAINQHAVGDSVEVLLFGGGKFRQVSLALRASPDAPRGKSVAPESSSSLKPSTSPRPRRGPPGSL